MHGELVHIKFTNPAPPNNGIDEGKVSKYYVRMEEG